MGGNPKALIEFCPGKAERPLMGSERSFQKGAIMLRIYKLDKVIVIIVANADAIIIIVLPPARVKT